MYVKSWRLRSTGGGLGRLRSTTDGGGGLGRTTGGGLGRMGDGGGSVGRGDATCLFFLFFLFFLKVTYMYMYVCKYMLLPLCKTIGSQ